MLRAAMPGEREGTGRRQKWRAHPRASGAKENVAWRIAESCPAEGHRRASPSSRAPVAGRLWKWGQMAAILDTSKDNNSLHWTAICRAKTRSST